MNDPIEMVDELKEQLRRLQSEADMITTADQAEAVRAAIAETSAFAARLAERWRVYEQAETVRERWRREKKGKE